VGKSSLGVPMRILIAGMGAIGSLLASYLSKEHEIFAVGRPWHINQIRKRGYLTLKVLYRSEKREIQLKHLATAFSVFSEEEFDYVFVTVKAYDTEQVLKEIIHSNIFSDCFVLFQNGLGNEEIARQILKDKNILRALTNNGANIPEPGVVIHAGLGETIIGGIYGKRKDTLAGKVADILTSSGLPSKAVANIYPYLFRKILINATINPLTALLRVKNRAVAENEELKKLAIRVAEEVVKVAKAYGVSIENPEKIIFDVAKKTGENISSMLQDILKNKRTEIDFINGAIIRMGKDKHIDTPTNEMIYLLIKALEQSKSYQV